MSNSSPVVLIYATVWWPLAARLAICFRDLGCKVHSICPPVHPLRSVDGIEPCLPIRAWSIQRSLIAAIDSVRPDYIVPTDDRAVWSLHALAIGRPEYRGLVVRSLGTEQSFETIRSRAKFLTLASSLEILTPRTEVLRSVDDAAQRAKTCHYPVVIKSDGTFGGRGVIVARSAQELENAYRRLTRRPSTLARLKRRIVDDDILAFAPAATSLSREISLQEFLTGVPANAMFACLRGEVPASLQVRTVCAQHAAGASLVVERIKDPKIEEAGKKLVKALGLSGFCGLDFLMGHQHQEPYLLEINPRATQLGHLPLEDGKAGANLAEVLCFAWTGRSVPQALHAPNNIRARIAFYPQAFALGANHPLFASAWLDRPDQEAGLLRELSRRSWPERRVLYRLFQKLYATPADEPVVYPPSEK